MAGGKIKRIWADPNREGKFDGRRGERYCAKCGNTVQQVRILRTLNLCEFCVKELEQKRDGVNSCRSCGKVVPDEIQKNNGYCRECLCPACGKPDANNVRKEGLCWRCMAVAGDFCRVCGKEAAAQVKKNKGLCEECLKVRRQKTEVRSQKVKTKSKAIEPVGAAARGIKIRQKIEAKRGKKTADKPPAKAPGAKAPRSQKPEARIQKSESRIQKPEDRSQKSEVRRKS